MTRFKSRPKKIRLAKKLKQTRWAPFWVIPKIFGPGRRIHPSRVTDRKRHWKRTKIKA